MPWYWTDDIARTLFESGRISADEADRMVAVPTALRRSEPTLEAAAEALAEEDEGRLAA